MQYKRNVFSNLILHVLTIIIGFVTSIVIARSLGTVKQGVFAYILLVFGIISSYGHLSINSSNGFFLKKSIFSKKSIIDNNVSILIILSIIYSIGVILFRGSIFDSNFYSLSLIWIIYAISLMFINFFSTLYIVDEKIYLYNRFVIFLSILKGLLIVLLYFINKLDLIWISVIYSVIELIKLIFMVFNLKIRYNFKISSEILKKELKYGFPLFLAALFIYLNYRADLFMIKIMLNESRLGIYSVAVHLAELAFIFPSAFTTAFEGKLYSCKSDNERNKITVQTVKIGFYVTLIICIIGMCCMPLVKVLYGNDYSDAGMTMVILLFGIVFASLGKIVPVYYYTTGRPKIHMYISLVVFIVNIIANYFLIPIFDINGAALASTISYTLYGILYILMLKKDGISLKNLFRINKNDLLKLKDTILLKEKRKLKENV